MSDNVTTAADACPPASPTLRSVPRFAVLRPVAAVKVPDITASFWMLKLLTTALGEAVSDYVLSTVGASGAVISAIVFAVVLAVQITTTAYRRIPYWSTVAMVAIFGTMVADIGRRALGISLGASVLLCAMAVAATFVIWWLVERTISVHDIDSRRREAFYWLAVLFTFALGTAAGDYAAFTLNLGFAGSIVFFAAAMAVPGIAFWRCNLNGVVAFWAAYILTRPLGASVADWASKPTKIGGLGFGDGPTALVLLAAGVLMLAAVHLGARSTRQRASAARIN